jgi:EAL domain-containing protein (putative c-di-GMP-specific phosphodiesterase class I)
VQGYLFSPPLRADKIPALLEGSLAMPLTRQLPAA